MEASKNIRSKGAKRAVNRTPEESRVK